MTGLVKSYGATPAVRGLDLAAPAGALTAVLGPNGAGKTTTVECCEGLRRPDAGSVRVLGLDPVADARALRPRVGVMLQDGGLPSTVPAGEVLAHVSRMYVAPRDVAALAARLGIDAFARTTVRRLSGGQRRRLALATAVVGRPEVLLLDEPTAGLDPQARLAVWDLVAELRGEGTTVLLTTHQIAEAQTLADHVVVVDHGRALVAGTPAELVGDDGVVRLSVRGAVPDVAARGLAAALADGGFTAPAAAGERAAASAGGIAVTVTTAGELEVRAPADPALLHAVTGWARDAGLLVTAMDAGRRTLEDVVLDLTGRELR